MATTSGGERRTSKILHRFSLRRHGGGGRGGEGDRVKLVEGEGGEGEIVGQRDVMSDAEIENVKVRVWYEPWEGGSGARRTPYYIQSV